MGPSDLPAIYKARKIYLWVEDHETRGYLDVVWADPEIGLLVAGGHGNIHAIVKTSREEGFTHVFGLRDRDFGRTNHANWASPQTTVMTSESLELENLVLDAEAMADCAVNTSGKVAADIEQDLLALASALPWWMSCRSVITEIHDRVLGDFIGHPRRGQVTTGPEAEGAIFGSSWWRDVLPVIDSRTTQEEVTQQLAERHTEYSAMLTDGRWKERYSGKELLGDMVSRLWTKKRPDKPRAAFIQAIGEAQRRMARVPREAVELREVLRDRMGLAP